ncbi:hypothetical protein OPS25_15335 [Alteromonas ponticola]|uniref:Bacteriocin n=1 Tax=Alteromonas aquimaris TaxID=2998417 RepID=A0ABT3PAZ4_9ALTE|nr:hypothetical protein [Alteromonas aquimaris]MCW8109879.1 hypothetical protein [Alteromonas aquimaris]
MKELHLDEIEAVSGGLYNFFLGYAAGKAIDGYWNWVAGGAGGWREDYNGRGYSDTLL